MALDVIGEIKAAEEKALEVRRVAAAAAKDAVRLATDENAQILEKELSAIKQSSASAVEAAGAEAEAEFKALHEKRAGECDELKRKAEVNLSRAADICLERILK